MSSLPVTHPSLCPPGGELTFSTHGSIHLDEDDVPAPTLVTEPVTEPVTGTRNDCVRLDASRMRRTPQGGLRGPAAVTRVGVFKYRHNDGPMKGKVVREYRPADEVFNADSMATLEDAPITDFHPNVGNGLVTKDNYTSLARGQVTNVTHDATHVLADAVIQDGTLAERVLRGERVELSSGYQCRFDWTPGVFEGQPYDVVQRGIHYNHVALLPRGGGRQGSDVALRFDAAILPVAMIVHLDGKDFDLSDEAQRAAYHAAMQAKVDAVAARADAAEAELAPIKAAQVQAARTTLETSARKVLGSKAPEAFTGLTDRQVRETALGGPQTDKSDDYVLARFDAALEAAEAPAPAAPPATDPALEAARSAMQPQGAPTTNEPTPPAWTQRWREPLTASKDK